MRALFAFSYTVRIVVIHFILINSSIANTKKYQNVRNESNLETLARQQVPTHTEEISGGRIWSKNLSDRSFREDRLVEFGERNVLLLNESAHRPSEDVKGVASRGTESHRRSKRCILAGLLHKKLMFAKHFFFPRPPPRPQPTPRPPPPPPTTRRTQPMTRRTNRPPTTTTTTPRLDTSRRRPPPPRHTPRRPPQPRFTTTTTKRTPKTTKTPSSSKPTTEAPKQQVLTQSPPAAAHALNLLEFRETTTASIVPDCKFIVHPGVPVINGKPKYDIRLAVVVEKITVIRRPPGYFVWEFVHPKIEACIELPVFGTGDTYVDPISKKVFIVFVDMRNTTLLIPKLSPTVEKSETCIYRFDKTLIFKAYWKRPGLGSSVVNGFPQHDVKTALWVWHTTKLIDSKGILVHRFPHPTDKYDVQIPAYGTDEYFESETSQVFLLFVDKRNRTLVVYKGVIDQKKIVREDAKIENLKREDEIRMIHKYREFGYKYGWGSIVIRGVPGYSLTEAKFVYKTETFVDSEGFVVIQFEHPITGQRIQIPPKGGDEYVMPSNSKIFIIFVDFAKRTLLIANNIQRSKTSRDCVNEININVNLAVMKYREIAHKENVGLTVIAGVPKYDITTSIFVNATYKIIDSDSFLVIYFIHPKTGEGIQIPVDGGDEYILAKESKVYVIFVDRFGRTLLIFKGPHLTNEKKSPPGEKPQGSMVIQGVPGYDESCVIFVNKTDKLVHSHKVPMIQFVHPITGHKIQIPANGGDEFLLPSTSQIFLIYVDSQGRTLLIFKEKYIPKEPPEPENGSNCKNLLSTIYKYRQVAQEREWGSMVIHRVPKYNKSCAIFVNKTERILDPDGCFVIQFVHPITEQKIQIPANGGDEYVVPSISKIFLIFVDAKGRTLLVYKPPPPSALKPLATGGSKCPNVFYAIDKYRLLARDKNWGTMVVQGGPKYNTTFVIFVDKTKKMIDSEGCVMIQFVHPLTEQKIEIPYYGGDEFVVPSSSKIFVIFVDNNARTLFIFKDKYVPKEPQLPNDRGDKCPNFKESMQKYQQMAREKEWGSIVIHGVPKYNPSLVTFVHRTKVTLDTDGCLIIQFAHPVTKQEMHVPYNGGDEFVMPLESKIYVVFLDTKGRTLLLFKDKYPSDETKPPNDKIVEKDKEKPKEPGSIVNAGVTTKYNISGAIFVDETQRAQDPDGFLLIHFVHPITRELIKIPFYGGVSYSPPFTTKVYIIFVDTKGRTLLILRPQRPTNDRSPENAEIVSFAIEKYGELAKKYGWGWIVIRGVPKYDISLAIFVNDTENKIDSDGCLVIEFVHPITKQKIPIPYHGGDEYVIPRTSKVYIIFVDPKGRTLLILKKEYSSNESKPGKDLDRVNKGISFAIEKYQEMGKKNGWGSIVIRGVPNYDISLAIFVNDTENKIDSDGCLVIEFVHPITKQKIQIPYHGGDEYVPPGTLRVYVLFVDTKGRALLILKKEYSSNESKPGKDLDQVNKGISFAIEKYQEMGKKNGWGSIVIRRVPNYDISHAIFVNDTENKIDSDGCLIIEFVHPITKQKIQIPYHGGDEYVPPGTLRVYVLFVDTKARTLLIFKNQYPSTHQHKAKKDIIDWIEKQQFPAATDSNKESEILKKWWNLSMEEGWGWLVMKGVPEYDLSRAIFVMKSEKVTDSSGIEWIRFVHPVTGREIKVPCVGTDEYTLSRSSQVFLIFVDLQGRTLLIFKADEKIPQDIGWGTLVVGGHPRYDLSRAIYVIERETTVDEKGTVMLHLVHPESREKIRMPFCGGDEYVDPHKAKIFLIVVDSRGKTILIFKDMDGARWNDRNSGKLEGIMKNYDLMARANSWGGLVIGGMPKHVALSRAIIVMETKTESGKNGMVMIRFEDPRNKRKMLVPFLGGDEYVDPRSFYIYVMFVDLQGQLLLIFKGMKNSGQSPESLHFGEDRFRKELDIFVKEYEAIAHRNKWGTLVRNGQPKYDLEKAIIARITSRTWTSNGHSIITFVHPINGEKMYIPAFGGDEYVDPKTREIFVIFVDTQGRTCLILKNNNSKNRSPNNQAIENIGNKPVAYTDGISVTVRPPLRPGSSVVVNDNPRLDLANATYVPSSSHNDDTDQGNMMINFIHPITHEPIKIGANQGEEYYDPKSQKVFNIFVDRGGRTLLIPKPERSPSFVQNLPGSMNEPQNININKNINSNVFLPRR